MILAFFFVCGLGSALANSTQEMVSVCGHSTDTTVQFPSGSAIAVQVDGASITLNADIEAAVKAKLQTAPYSMTFGAGDSVRLIPAHN